LSQGIGGIVEVLVKEVINIFSHGQDLTQDFKNAINFWKVGDYYHSGFYVGEIVGILLQD